MQNCTVNFMIRALQTVNVEIVAHFGNNTLGHIMEKHIWAYYDM